MNRRRLSALAGLLVSAAAAPSALAQTPPGNLPTPPSPAPAPSAMQAPPPNAVIEWNRTLLSIVRTKTPQPLQPPTVHATRAFAMLHLGIYDAVVAVDGGSPYLPEHLLTRPASAPAAADQAAHDVLAALYPSQQAVLDSQLGADLAAIPAGARLSRGIKAGQTAAQAILANRAQDGSAATQPPYTLPAGPGIFEPAAPATAVFTHWANVKPFVLTRTSEFRPQAPAPLNSPAYLRTVQQVESLGQSASTTRTPDQTTIATFWGGSIWDYWNEIAQSASFAHHDTLAQDAQLFAQLNVSFADTVIAFYDAKYTYHLWRPQTAIQSGFAGFPANPSWTPLGKTPADPSYPGAHAAISQAGATVLGSFFHNDGQALTVTSEVMPGATRQFSGFAAAAGEASASRVFAGVHTTMDEEAGQQLGGSVARFVLHRGSLAARRATPARHVRRGRPSSRPQVMK
jgi:membrane-associated phospholipid phosphatase